MPLWKRYAVIALLAVLIVIAGYVLYTKVLHKASPAAASSSPPPAAAVSTGAGSSPAVRAATPTTTVPGGIPVSSRDPFGS